MFTHSFAVASALVAGTMAQSTSVTSLFLYGSEGDNIVASVISAAPQETTYFVTCAAGTDGSDCGFGPGITFVDGPSTLGLHITEDGAFTMDVDCKVASQTATCVETDAGAEANDPGTMTQVLSDLSNSMLPVTITAGLDKLQAGGSATATGSSATTGTAEPTASASSGPTETGASASSTAKSSSATGTSTSSASSSASTTSGAVAGAGQNFVLAGLAGVVGLLMAL
ncbi:hypothetical protein Daus18300_007256 [Diaporthe australafricana]|uniref:GPI anchored protein n=1 Tax=Diaporthe australafricana TaxID=127596 RepID=A0ABR3WNY5_9PEZI